MVLEATIIIVDNSEHSRNGDYLPSRFDAQSDAVNLIFSAKTQANPESSVGLMSMGGSQPEVLTTLTTDHGKIIDGLHRTKIKGKSNFSGALNVAGLALKHRQNKSQHQRIIVFTCSPIVESEKDFIKLAKRMKKNTIAVDIIAFGNLDPDNTKKVEAFHEAIKGSADGSNLAIIPPSSNLLSDSIVTTPILAGEGGSGQGMGGSGGDDGGSGGNAFEYGVDPNTDPELALALRMSMEEEEKRRQREDEAKAKAEGKTALESVAEDGEASKPDGEGSSAAVDGAVSKSEKDEDKKGEGDSKDRMDTS